MQDEIIARLRRLNQEFYQSYATSFAETRARLQPGVVRCLDTVSLSTSVLDLGCGNGELARGLHVRGHEGQYFGLDSSIQLIALARQRCIHPRAQFRLADLAQETWISALPTSFDRVFAFAVFHHVPSQELRQRILRQVHTILSTEGNFVLSNWNFMESPRLRERILPWETINLRAEDLEEGDYLLDWRRGGYALRYVHLFNEEELLELAQTTGFQVAETFYSDGEGGRLGLYQTWKKV